MPYSSPQSGFFGMHLPAKRAKKKPQVTHMKARPITCRNASASQLYINWLERVPVLIEQVAAGTVQAGQCSHRQVSLDLGAGWCCNGAWCRAWRVAACGGELHTSPMRRQCCVLLARTVHSHMRRELKAAPSRPAMAALMSTKGSCSIQSRFSMGFTPLKPIIPCWALQPGRQEAVSTDASGQQAVVQEDMASRLWYRKTWPAGCGTGRHGQQAVVQEDMASRTASWWWRSGLQPIQGITLTRQRHVFAVHTNNT
jgi:hypothetical protein